MANDNHDKKVTTIHGVAMDGRPTTKMTPLNEGRDPVAMTPLEKGRLPTNITTLPNDINSGRMPASVTPLTPGGRSAPETAPGATPQAPDPANDGKK